MSWKITCSSYSRGLTIDFKPLCAFLVSRSCPGNNIEYPGNNRTPRGRVLLMHVGTCPH